MTIVGRGEMLPLRATYHILWNIVGYVNVDGVVVLGRRLEVPRRSKLNKVRPGNGRRMS